MIVMNHADLLDELYMECMGRLNDLNPDDPEFDLVRKKAEFYQKQRDKEIENGLKIEQSEREQKELELKQVREVREAAAAKDAAKRELRKAIIDVSLGILNTSVQIGTGCFWMHTYRMDALRNYPLTVPDKTATEPMKMLNQFKPR